MIAAAMKQGTNAPISRVRRTLAGRFSAVERAPRQKSAQIKERTHHLLYNQQIM